jgi:hypothetical protein
MNVVLTCSIFAQFKKGLFTEPHSYITYGLANSACTDLVEKESIANAKRDECKC